jgi:hypothetical protein
MSRRDIEAGSDRWDAARRHLGELPTSAKFIAIVAACEQTAGGNPDVC